MSSEQSRGDGRSSLEFEYYRYCRSQNKPYFGRVMWASQGLPLRHVVMQELVRLESVRVGSGPLHILEVGSWAGGSAITWADALKRHHGGNGRVICVDPWKPYFDLTKRPEAPVYREMWNALQDDSIYDLFLHNIAAAGHRDVVLPFRGQSREMLPAFPFRYFDIVFIDGDHSYAAVAADLKLASALVKDGGILCGDDLELQIEEIDQAYARTQTESDYVRDPRSGREYHPGVTLAVGESLGRVSSIVGCWAARKNGTGWEATEMSKVVCAADHIPAHLAPQEPLSDSAFLAWRKTLGTAVKKPASSAAADVPAHRTRVLLIQLDFLTWKTARPWSYSGAYGVSDGLRANGVECITIPAIAEIPCSSPASWLSHAKQFFQGQRFDQVWIWLVHTALDSRTLEWIAELAPIRVGVLMETLLYDEDDYLWAPHLRHRMPELEKQLPYLTHLLAPDERDAVALKNRGKTEVLWWPPMVPRRYIPSSESTPRFDRAVFHGVPYGPRRNWVAHPALRDLMTFQQPADPPTDYQRMFDRLQQASQQLLTSGRPVSESQLNDYAACLQQVREGEFTEWMAALGHWAAIVNLPSLAKFYGGRVFESMASGRPVLSWSIPAHPKNRNLFEADKEIILFPGDQPAALAAKLERVLRDRPFAERVARAGRRKAERYHTSEYRIQQTLRWIETGAEPDYGTRAGFHLPISLGASSASCPPSYDTKTTVFVLTVDDPAFPACKTALDAQLGTTFKLEIIRNVCPFSAAAQRMISDCRTEYFIQVDEDMILQPDAVASMEAVMEAAPDDVGMICFHLFDEDRGIPIQGVKIYRAALMKPLMFQDVKASEMDLLDQMGRQGIAWILHPDVMGQHGTHYTPATIYRRYKTMYEKDIRQWNTLTVDIRRKADQFRESGDLLALFALLGAAHGIVLAPLVSNREKDARQYALKELEVFTRLFLSEQPTTQPYDPSKSDMPLSNPPIPFDQVQWKPGTLESKITKVSNSAARSKPILIVTPHFWPSVGGVEMVVEDLGIGLTEAGFSVQVACHRQADRASRMYRGIEIIEVSGPEVMHDGLPVAGGEVAQLVASGRYEAVIVLGSPIHPFFYVMLEIPDLKSRRIFFQPTINQEGYDFLRSCQHGQSVLRQLADQSTAVIVLGEQTPDARYCREERIPTMMIPNGTKPLAPTGDFRRRHGIAEDTFVLLQVANLYRVKNHLRLLNTFTPVPSGVKLVMIGHETCETEYVAEVRTALAARPEVLFIPGLDRQGVAEAMQAADLVLLCSEGEVSPLCLLEAMSLRRPWLATPGCGTATAQAGGLVLPLAEFPEAVWVLRQHPDYRSRLGQAGYEHWDMCFQWEPILAAWITLLETGRLATLFEMPATVARERDELLATYGRLKTGSSAGLQDRISSPAEAPATRATIACVKQQPTTHDVIIPSYEGLMDQDQFYVNLFVNSPYWSMPEPNPDEAARWVKIAVFLEHILQRVRKNHPDASLRIIEIGCGRGWLTNLASAYGTVEGVEPVAGVVAHAKTLFPQYRFEPGTAETVLARSDFRPYDVVLCSEVIEHVPHEQKPTFLEGLKRLLTPDGYLILTTPRGEMWERWQTIAPPNQPVEAWVTEQQLENYLIGQEFAPVGIERVHVEIPSLRYIPSVTAHDLKTRELVPIYQVWAAQRAAAKMGRPSMKRPPMVSVIIPTYNRPDRLRMAIESVASQEYQDFQIIVVNDGTVPVEAIVSDLNRDGRIMLVTHDRNRGLAASRNTGLRQATGKYVCYLDDDDRFLPDHLSTLVKRLEVGDCKVAYTDAWRVHERVVNGRITEYQRDRPYSHEFNAHQLLINNYMPVLCVMHERACLDEVGGFDESLYVHEDWDLWIRLAACYLFIHIPKTTAEFTWRIDGSTMSSQPREAFVRTAEIIYRKYVHHAAPYPKIVQHQRERLAAMRRELAVKRFDCSIIIPVWNKVDLTTQCLIALSEVTDGVSYEVIVVDNGSTDSTQEFMKSLSGDVQVIRNSENLGFAKACNQGAAAATGDYLVFLNNDTIPLKGWLSTLVDEVKAHPNVAIVGSKLLYQDRSVQHAGVAVDRRSHTPYHIYRGFAESHPAVNKRRELNAVTGACLLIRRSLFSDVGGFEEGYVNGFEDVDLCFKVRERGHTIVYQPKSVVFHLESQTPGRKQHEAENGRRLMQRWGKAWWLVDNDSLFVSDGYKVVEVSQHGRSQQALQLLEDPKDRQAWEVVAETQQAGKHRDEAAVVRQLARYAEWPADRDVLMWGASVAEAVKQPTMAEAFRRRVATIDNPFEEQITIIREALTKGQVATAEARLELLLKQHPMHAEGLLLKGILCMQREQHEQAEMAFGTALHGGVERRKCLMGMGMAAMGRGYAQGAWERFREVLVDYPDDAEAIHWLLRAGAAQNRWHELGEQLHSYVKRNPEDLASRFAYAGVLLRAEQINAARREYDALLRIAPTYDGLEQLGRAISGREAVLIMEAASL
ncbi:glycosyltransferase [Nitrospira sp. CMX1]